MEFINKQILDEIEVRNFNDTKEAESFKKIIGIIINRICTFIFNKDVDYDFNRINQKVKDLTIECRDGISPEYVLETNTIYLSRYNQKGERLSENAQIIYIIHEIFHFMSLKNHPDSLSRYYYAFEEFFTEYLTFLIVLSCGIEFENYYRQNQIGYFNIEDNKFIRELTKNIDFKKLLTAYFSNSKTLLRQEVPEEVLLNMQDYFDYYEAIYDKYNLPKKYLEEQLKNNRLLALERSKLDEKLSKINTSISNINKTNKHY